MHRLLLLLLFIFVSFQLSADYLELKRNSGIKAQPNKEAPVVYQGVEKELFLILDNGKRTNGYYHVAIDVDGYYGLTMPVISVKLCQSERVYNDIKK